MVARIAGALTVFACVSMTGCLREPASATGLAGGAGGQSAPSVAPVTANDLKELEARLTKAMVKGDEEVREQINDEIDPLDGRLRAAERDLRDQADIVEKLAQKTASGSYAFNIKGQLQVPEFQSEFAEAVGTQWTQRKGLFIVYNDTPDDQWISVNGEWFQVLADKHLELGVPLATVITELPGAEPAKPWNRWTLRDGSYELRIHIR